MFQSSPPPKNILLNGVDAITGDYLFAPQSVQEWVLQAQAEFNYTTNAEQQITKTLSAKKSEPQLGFDAPLEDPAQARWGVILADADTQLQAALEPLIKHRADTLHFTPPIFQYKAGTTALDFLAANGVARGYGEVNQVPYYLLLVGDPLAIPFEFQYELDSEYATGRLCFERTEDYAAYVQQLIDYATANVVPTSRDLVYWGTAHPNDEATDSTSRYLVNPLYEKVDTTRGWNKELFDGTRATKPNLVAAFERAAAPTLVFTASHGLGFRKPDSRQPKLQGAIVTQEWKRGTPTTNDCLLTAADFDSPRRVHGMVHFCLACYGAGTPLRDDYTHGENVLARVLTEKPFVARLPQQMLGMGALGFFGHVDAALTDSFMTPGATPHIHGFQRALNALLKGFPLGHALRDLHDRGTQLGASLIENLNGKDLGKDVSDQVIADQWKQRNDARAFILLGDPAARIRVPPL